MKKKIFLKIFLLFTLLSFYVFQKNDFIERVYLLNSLEKEIFSLSEANLKLKISLFSKNNFKIKELAQEFGFEKIKKIYFIKIEPKVLASKR